MDRVNKKRAISLGLRVGLMFLATVGMVILLAYYMLSRNFQGLLTDYTIKLVESMTNQGVTMIETDLEMNRKEAKFLANAFEHTKDEQTLRFPAADDQEDLLRMVYVNETGSFASDGRKLDIREREDIKEAWTGKISIYGPYYNEEQEYVICFSAPIIQNDQVVGVLSVEKDGYYFCDLIKGIRFVNSGEAYIINEQGTDIAVSDETHIEWVTSQYNARKLLEEELSEETKSILELEQKGLNGETGLGTYIWNDGIAYVFYQPIPSTGWVLLAGLREEELASMTMTAMFATISKGPILAGCIILILFLTGVIMYWIISSMRKTARINERLKFIANYDALTGLMNRNSYHAVLDQLADGSHQSLGCVYIDVNGLHELNNHLGHQAGDRMLAAVGMALQRAFPKEQIFRIGGDEFVVLCIDKPDKDLANTMEEVRSVLKEQHYEISVGIVVQDPLINALTLINEAEAAMQRDKRTFYQSAGNERRMRTLDERMEQLIIEKQDADTFLSVLAPVFRGIYFVNLINDSIRHLNIPPYFEECLKETGHRYSQALLLYAQRHVKSEYLSLFQELSNYELLEKKLEQGQLVEYRYQKNNGDWLRLRILKFKGYDAFTKDTLWIFNIIDR